MSDSIDLKTVTELLRDISLELRRQHKVDEDGESTSTGAPYGASTSELMVQELELNFGEFQTL